MIDKYEIQEIIGDFFEGFDTSDAAKKVVLEAANGPMLTKQGLQKFYIDLDTLLLENIDLSEAIWSVGIEEKYRGNEEDIVYLYDLSNSQNLMERIKSLENGEQKWEAISVKILTRL